MASAAERLTAAAVTTVEEADEAGLSAEGGLGLEATRLSAPLESILIGESCLREGDRLPNEEGGLRLSEGVIETMGAEECGASEPNGEPSGRLPLESVGVGEVRSRLPRRAAAALEEFCSSLILACHSRA